MNKKLKKLIALTACAVKIKIRLIKISNRGKI